jgi:Ankyrin repeats (3 copies)
MFPNPQDALPLPSHPSLEQYRKLAKDLVKACESDPSAISAWADRWMQSLRGTADRKHVDRAVSAVEEFATKTLKGNERACVLADAQFVIARSHGFTSWAEFGAHLEALENTRDSAAAAFEAAADAIVRGDEATLQQLLRKHPDLIRARSARAHRATLLHYVSANGVENYRQQSPPNAARITELLLAAGADIEAEADVYGGGSTTLGLVATSTPPREAGVQIPVMAVLLDHGAQIEQPNASKFGGVIYACLANGCPAAARYLVERGAHFGIVGAAGIGRLDVVQQLVEGSNPERREMALRYAAGYGELEVVRFLLDRGVNVDGHHGDGKTALYYAMRGDHADAVRLLLARGAQPLAVEAPEEA